MLSTFFKINVVMSEFSESVERAPLQVLEVGAGLGKIVDEQVETIQQSRNFEINDDEFFRMENGDETIVNMYDFERAVSPEKKQYFVEIDRYWVNKPYSFISIFNSKKENEYKYYAVEPYLTDGEESLLNFLGEKIQSQLRYESDRLGSEQTGGERRETIRTEAITVLNDYGLYDGNMFSGDSSDGLVHKLRGLLGNETEDAESGDEGEDDSVVRYNDRQEKYVDEKLESLTDRQAEKILYYLTRNFIDFREIDPITHDINVEDISCDGYNSPVFVYHSDYEQIITNITHGRDELDDFVAELSQRAGKGISKRKPQVDATLPDGSRAQLTLGDEVSDHGTNYTIRQFKDVPFTPIDLINWKTFSLNQMAFLWLCIENKKSLVFAGGTASGKTTSLNAISLFIPSSSKIVSIEDTREVELPQRNWIASVTRPSFTDEGKGDIDEFNLLEAALRQRPEYIVMGEVRGEEGRTLFQVMSTGHTTYTTFHADSVGEVLKRFTTEPINVSKTMFTALDLVSIQSSTRVNGKKSRRNQGITEVNHYDPENDEINVNDIYEWQAETDSFIQVGGSSVLEEIKFDRGWTQEKLEAELKKRQLVMAYLIKKQLTTYTQVAATLQAFINEPETVLSLIANNELESSLQNLREMESVFIDVDAQKEERTPRPSPTKDVKQKVDETLQNSLSMLKQYKDIDGEILSALKSIDDQEDKKLENMITTEAQELLNKTNSD